MTMMTMTTTRIQTGTLWWQPVLDYFFEEMNNERRGIVSRIENQKVGAVQKVVVFVLYYLQ